MTTTTARTTTAWRPDAPQHPPTAPKNDMGEYVAPEPHFDDWDQTPHGIFIVGIDKVALGDVVFGGTHQVEGIGRANQRGSEAFRLDLNFVVAPSMEPSARAIIPIDQLVSIKRYFPTPGHGYAWTRLTDTAEQKQWPARLLPDYGSGTEFCCDRDQNTVNQHGYDASATMCDVCVDSWELDYEVVRWGPNNH